jgi:alpha-tubulin suppressor-like RCC1 family protein
MIKLAICLLALAGCGLPEKTHCATTDDCLGEHVCIDGVCQSTSPDACGPTRATCAAEATCTTMPDGAACVCNTGYEGNGLACADLDECAAASSPCATHATCTNQPGKFACACDAGFTGDGSYCVPKTFTKVAAAGGFTCALASDGGIYCWGTNVYGDLGDGTTAARDRPTQVGTATDWIDVDARTNLGCGIRTDHSMWCWGFGTTGQIGDGKNMSAYAPTMVISDKPGVGWKAMALGRQALCGIHDDGSLACWGFDRITGGSVTTPLAVGSDTDWTDVSVGTVRCGIRGMPGPLYCWGKSQFGDLGLGAITSQDTPAQVGTDLWKRVEVGYFNTCGIRSDNALLCWGNNTATQTALRYGNTPQQVGTATDWQAVSISTEGVLGLRAGGDAYAWGNNLFGQLGPSDALEIVQPAPLRGGLSGWSQVSSGNVHGCGIAAGRTYCWGTIGEGYLGNGVTTSLYAPTKIGSDRWTAIAGGTGQCGLRDDGALMCWGNSGTLGVGFGNTDPVWAPTRLGTDAWSAVAGTTSGSQNAAMCGISGGKPYCWGDNTKGQLGIGSTVSPQRSPVAVNVPGASTWTEIAIATHTCAIASDATLWCWGANDVGQLGTGTTSTTPTTAPASPLGGAWLHVAVTNYGFQNASMTCGIKTDHTLWCWGRDQPPDATQHLVPTQVGTDNTWASLSIGATANTTYLTGAATCAIKLNGTLWCWGLWLGDGTMTTSPTPVQVGTATDWKTVAAGGEICATRAGGTLWCWANLGLLGDGNPATYDTLSFSTVTMSPTQIGSDTDWSTAMTTGNGSSESCAIKTDGSLWCWGLQAAPIPGVEPTPVPVN